MLLVLVIMKKDIAFVDVVCEDEADASCQGMSLVPDSALEPNEEEV